METKRGQVLSESNKWQLLFPGRYVRESCMYVLVVIVEETCIYALLLDKHHLARKVSFYVMHIQQHSVTLV